MLKNKRRQQTATFLEGLNGHYQRRESPPPIPNTMNMSQPRHQTQSTTGSSTQSLQTIGIVQHPSITSSTASAPIKKHSNSALTPFNDHPKPSASSTSLPMAGLMSTSTPGVQFGLFQPNPQTIQQQRRLSHTPRGSRTVSTRSELSSHSFSNPRQTNVVQVPPQQSRQIYVQNNSQYPQRYSARSDQNQKRQRRSLTSSLSIDIPPWLKLYGEAPFQSDHLLKWTMFKLPQLQQFDRMLRKLYKQEVLNTVSKYERVRAEINTELLRRFEGN
uniref:SARAH domain-containing protein n=1 Tax=Bursaphelenchus xylophilus TaxID=6326 RepID=A0A1I7RJC2_BURXY